MGEVLSPPFPVVYSQLFCLADVEGKLVLAPHCQVIDVPSKDVLIVGGDQASHHRVVSKLNDGVGVVRCHAVVGEQGVHIKSNVFI